MSENLKPNLKPLYIDTETGRLKFNNEQPADGAIVAHLVYSAGGELTCDMNASEMIDYLQDGTPVFLQTENEGEMITTGNCLASTEAPDQEVVFYLETRDRNLKFVIKADGSVGVTDKLLLLRARVYYDGSAYVCDKAFAEINEALQAGVPVGLHLSVDGQSYLSSLAGAAQDYVYFRVWGPDGWGWGTVTVYASESVTVVWDSVKP